MKYFKIEFRVDNLYMIRNKFAIVCAEDENHATSLLKSKYKNKNETILSIDSVKQVNENGKYAVFIFDSNLN